MDHEETFRKVDADWYLETMFVEGDNDMAILSTQVLMDFYRTGFTHPDTRTPGHAERNAELVKRAPNRLIPLGGIDPRAPDALGQVDHQVKDLGMRGFKWYTGRMARGVARVEGQRPDGLPALRAVHRAGYHEYALPQGPRDGAAGAGEVRRPRHRRAVDALPGAQLHRRPLRAAAARRFLLAVRPPPERLRVPCRPGRPLPRTRSDAPRDDQTRPRPRIRLTSK